MTDTVQIIDSTAKPKSYVRARDVARARKGQAKVYSRYVPTPEHEAIVREAANLGLPDGDIARLIQRDEGLLLRHYGQVIEDERAFANRYVSRKLKTLIDNGHAGSIQFWLSRRVQGWKDDTPKATNAVQVVVNLSDTLRQAMASLEGVKREVPALEAKAQAVVSETTEAVSKRTK